MTRRNKNKRAATKTKRAATKQIDSESSAATSCGSGYAFYGWPQIGRREIQRTLAFPQQVYGSLPGRT
jgi:hypothetical protein